MTNNKYNITGQQLAMSRLAGAAGAGIFEIAVFHPIDTVTKRLMSNQNNIKASSISNIQNIIFRKHSNSSMLVKYRSLFPGIYWALSYKITQRIFKWGGQPYIYDMLEDNFSNEFYHYFGELAKPMMAGTAGAIVGASEISFLPLDVLKIKSQTNPDALDGLKKKLHDSRIKNGYLGSLRTTGVQMLPSLYSGAAWTALRNSSGTFILFGASSWYTKNIFGIVDKSELTLSQYFTAATFSSILTIAITNPIDVIKTRCQNKSFATNVSGIQIARDLLAKEGFYAFFKGIFPKLITVGPKLVTSFAVSQWMIQQLQQSFADRNNSSFQ